MKFLHISDLHYAPKADGRTSRRLREEFLQCLRDARIQAEELIVTGDYRHAVLQKDEPPEEAAEKAAGFILETAGALGIRDPRAHVHLVPGNHDRDRDPDPARAQSIRAAYSNDRGVFSPEDLSYLQSQFGFFRLVCRKLYGSDSVWPEDRLHICREAGDTVLLLLNTAIMHNASEDRGRLLIGNDELDRLVRETCASYPGRPVAVLAHHPPDYFEEHEKKAVEDILRDRPVKLYLCGDAHEVWARQVNGYLEITMGCMKSGDGIQAAFLWGDTAGGVYQAYHWAEAWEPYTRFNAAVRGMLPGTGDAPPLTDALIEEEQRRLQNEVLLPWMKDSASHRAVFPKIFMEPELESLKCREERSFRHLLDHKGQNIVLTGGAGAGKTTLLRYLFLYRNDSHDLLYLKASSLLGDASGLDGYEQAVRALALGQRRDSRPRLILLDGVDEAAGGGMEALLQQLEALLRQPEGQASVWLGWRDEDYAKRETGELQRRIFDVIRLLPWDPDRAWQYVRIYGEETGQAAVAAGYQALLDRGEDLGSFTCSPFQLTLLVYLLENAPRLPKLRAYLDSGNRSIYGLYEQFLLCWLQKERERGTSRLPEKEILRTLQEAARQLYYGNSCELGEAAYGDTAVTGLLTFAAWRDCRTATGFYHRSLCAFFCAREVFGAVMDGGEALVRALRIPLRNDVTDFLQSAFGVVEEKDLRRVRAHLMDVYWQVLRPRWWCPFSAVRAAIRGCGEEERFYLRNELVYLLTRIPDPAGTTAAFLERAYRREEDPFMKLDLAYGAALAGPAWIALEYAKSLVPGSESDLTNRSWTAAYYGDVQAVPYHYRDTKDQPWTKAREARLRRFQSRKRKAIRFRILDFPLMYCFYESRDWADVSETDYEIIRQAETGCSEYTEEEREFLRGQKSRLLEEYRKHLDARPEEERQP